MKTTTAQTSWESRFFTNYQPHINCTIYIYIYIYIYLVDLKSISETSCQISDISLFLFTHLYY